MTGRLPPSFTPLVQTFKYKQSSLGPSVDAGCRIPKYSNCFTPRARFDCGAKCPYSKASRMPVHGSGGCGGIKRLAPPVGAPYGIPLNVLTPSMMRPRSLPLRVPTMGVPPPSVAARTRVARTGNNIAPLKKERRFKSRLCLFMMRTYTRPLGRRDGGLCIQLHNETSFQILLRQFFHRRDVRLMRGIQSRQPRWIEIDMCSIQKAE